MSSIWFGAIGKMPGKASWHSNESETAAALRLRKQGWEGMSGRRLPGAAGRAALALAAGLMLLGAASASRAGYNGGAEGLARYKESGSSFLGENGDLMLVMGGLGCAVLGVFGYLHFREWQV